MRTPTICLAVALACAAFTSDASANGWALRTGKWVGKTIAGGLLYDSVRPDDAEAAPVEREEWRPPAHDRGPASQPMTDVCVVPGIGSCALPYPIPAGAPCSCY